MIDALTAKLRAHVDAHGLRPTAELLGLHQETLLRFLADAPARESSTQRVRERAVRVLGL